MPWYLKGPRDDSGFRTCRDLSKKEGTKSPNINEYCCYMDVEQRKESHTIHSHKSGNI